MTSLYQTVLHTFFQFLLKLLSSRFKPENLFTKPITALTLLSFQFLNGFSISLRHCKTFLVRGAIIIVYVTFFLFLHLLVFSQLYSVAAISSSWFIEALSLLKQWYPFTFLLQEFWVSFLLPEPECLHTLYRCTFILMAPKISL